MSDKLLIFGAGGHGKSVVNSIYPGLYDDIVFIDRAHRVGQYVDSYPIVGTEHHLCDLYHSGYTDAVVAIGSIGIPTERIRVFELLKSYGFSFPPIIDPTAMVSDRCTIGSGVFIGKGAIIETGSKIGQFSIVNLGAIVGHDCKVGAFTHVGVNCSIGGGSIIGDSTHIGFHSCVRQGITIGSESIIGMGSVVTKSVPDKVTAYGVPCRVH